jgi:hypothetical protein
LEDWTGGEKGLDLAEQFFVEFNLPALQEHYPELADRVSAGLVGQGTVVEAAMQFTFLLNRQLAPYCKWLHWDFAQLTWGPPFS